MNKKYKIGAISKILGIPSQTLHYYEKCGFVHPVKDKESNYRYYDAWDINFLLDSKYLRSFEFSNAQIEEMINKDDLCELQKRYKDQEEVLWKQLFHYQNLLKNIKDEQKRLETISHHLGHFTEIRSPALFFTPYRYRDTYKKSDDAADLPQMEEWLSHFPSIRATFKIASDEKEYGAFHETGYWWGFSATPDLLHEFDSTAKDKMEYLPVQPCIYTIFKAGDQNTFMTSLTDQVLNPVRKKGYSITGAPYGCLIVRIHEGEEFARYFEIWVPIEF